ncbi:MAG: hypothetical protein RL235_64, partial [Chlamydiota bacterium]
MLNTLFDPKIKTFDELLEILDVCRIRDHKIVQCHGVFDLLHPGHIRHFKEAKALGHVLVVSVTPDRFVNKGPGRPVFTESLRLESIAALADVDYVVLNDAPDAISAILKVRPSYYVKGIEYKDHGADVTGKISAEAKAVEAGGGEIYYTDDIVFSSSSLLNKYFDSMPPIVSAFMGRLRETYTGEMVVQSIHALNKLKVLVVGDAIIDEYQYVEPMGQSGKGLHMVARCKEKDHFLGGSLIVANHVAQFAGEVTLLTAIGKHCPYRSFIQDALDPKIQTQFILHDNAQTLTKKRYVLQDGKAITKLFETYIGCEERVRVDQLEAMVTFLDHLSSDYDLVLVCDFGNGFLQEPVISALGDLPHFMALNTQINSGNRGYNVVTNYRKADYISLNEPELRLAAHDRTSSVADLADDMASLMQCRTISVTRGVQGVLVAAVDRQPIEIPAFSTTSVDRVGAGDSYLALSSLCMAAGYEPLLSGFIGSVAAAMSVQTVGNQEAIQKTALLKYI